MTSDYDFVIGQGDTSPSIERQLTDEDGNAIDLTGFKQVKFHMVRAKDDSVKVDDDDSGNVSVTDASNGKVKYDWQSADTDTFGRYLGEFQVKYNDGTIETFPADGHIDVKIARELA